MVLPCRLGRKGNLACFVCWCTRSSCASTGAAVKPCSDSNEPCVGRLGCGPQLAASMLRSYCARMPSSSDTPGSISHDPMLRLQLLGFNCIRVPFSFQNLFNLAASSKTGYCNAVPDATLRSSIIPPGVSVPSAATLPSLVCPVTLSHQPACSQDLAWHPVHPNAPSASRLHGASNPGHSRTSQGRAASHTFWSAAAGPDCACCARCRRSRRAAPRPSATRACPTTASTTASCTSSRHGRPPLWP